LRGASVIQEVKRDASHLDFRCWHRGSVPQFQRDLHLVAAIVLDNLHRHVGQIVSRIFRNLYAVFIDDLPEVSVFVKKPYRDERDISKSLAVFQMIAGEGTQTPE